MNRREMIAGGTSVAATAALGGNASALVPADALRLRPAEQRGKSDLGWLKSNFSFSFAQYYDPAHTHFENLRVINDDLIAGGGGFPMHPHKDFEIFSYVLDGAIEHKDSMGNGSVVKAGGVQYMSAGSGVTHSEFNPSATDQMRLLQIWLMPNVFGEQPRYDTLDIDPAEKDGKLKLFLSADGRNGSIAARADADVYAATLKGDQEISFTVRSGQKAWIQIARGNVSVNGMDLRRGDGLAVEQPGTLTFTKGDDAEFLLFDLKVI
ncbi:pirin family protein [Parvularcula sp. IMCC14364]|uniref:pirin family protein n=1 Tax=Parvularcula sp. IMCC14364 TaxID=3067902 RepID=UPI0027403649|nr:pirin family protein [Parvularcula sp. IMCC14364]